MTRERLVDIAEDDIDRALRQARSTGKARPQGRQPMPHQLAVLESRRRSKCKGIVAFATGAGKTLTGLAAVKEWTASGRPALILVPGRELHRQWRAELALEMPEAVPLLCGGGFGLTKWRDLLPLYTQVAPPGPDRRISVSRPMQRSRQQSFNPCFEVARTCLSSRMRCITWAVRAIAWPF